MDEEDLFIDEDFDLLHILEKAEIEFGHTQQQQNQQPQQQQQQVYQDFNTNTNTNTTLNPVPFLQQPLQLQHMPLASPFKREPAKGRSNWEPVETLDCFQNEYQQSISTTTVEEIQWKEKQKVQEAQLERALREAERLRSELIFKNQELDDTRAGLKDANDRLQQMSQKDWMDVDQHFPTTSTQTTTTSITGNTAVMDISNNTVSSRRRPLFPSSNARLTGTKRPRTSVSPSPSPTVGSSNRYPSVAPPQLTKWEKEDEDKKQFIMTQAVNSAVAQQLRHLKQSIEQKRAAKKEKDVHDFIQCLGTVEFLKVSHQELTEHPLQVSVILPKLTQYLKPDKINLKTDTNLLAMANDITQCVSQVTDNGVKATVLQLLIILRTYINFCIKEEKHLFFVRTVELLYTLMVHYSDQVTSHLLKELSGADDQSTLYSLAKGLNLLPLRNNTEANSKTNLIRGLPDLTNKSYVRIKNVLQPYYLSPSDARTLLTGVSPQEAEKVSSKVLHLLNHAMIQLSHHGRDREAMEKTKSMKRFLFLLDDAGFIGLLSSQKSLETANNALAIINTLVLDGNVDWIRRMRYVSVLKKITALLISLRPLASRVELKWYRLKITAVRLYLNMMSLRPVPLTTESALKLVLTACLHVLNNECLRIQEAVTPPFATVPAIESEILLTETLSLVNEVLDVYPVLLGYEEDDIHFQTLHSVKMVSDVFDKQFDKSHKGHSVLDSIGKILHEKQKSLEEALQAT